MDKACLPSSELAPKSSPKADSIIPDNVKP